MTFAGAILELKGSIKCIRRGTFTEIISLIKHHNITFVLKDIFSLEIKSGSIQWLIHKIFLGSSR